MSLSTADSRSPAWRTAKNWTSAPSLAAALPQMTSIPLTFRRCGRKPLPLPRNSPSRKLPRHSKARVNADLSRDGLDETRYLHYMDIHSHNSMEAKFSPVDDQDERATRLYTVLGRLDRFFPEITVRMSCGGTYCELDPGLIFEGLGEVFPREWRDNVKTGETRAIKDAKARLREVLLSGTFLEGEL